MTSFFGANPEFSAGLVPRRTDHMQQEASMAANPSNPSRATFVRNLQSLVEIILLDHAYSKPWSAHPEAGKARPVKTLFLPKSEELEVDLAPEDDMIIDVCEPVASPPSVIVYDTTKARTVMAECEKHVTAVTSKRTPDTWEEQINRNGWGPKQNSLFDKVIKVLSTLRLARLAYEQANNEPVKRRISTDKATKRFRQILNGIEWDPKLTTWLHSILVDGLSIHLLACYLDILQTLRAKAPSLVDRMISSPISQRRGPAANVEALSLLLKRPWDPSHGLVTQHKSRKLPGSPLLLIVPSGPTTSTGSGTSSKRTRFWHNQLSVLGKVVPVTMHTSNGGSGVSITQCLDHIIGAVRTKVLELRSHFPNRPVILIGWSIGALVSCQVALMESVCAVVCLGFPLAGIDGARGDVEDPLLELKTPTLFVIGSNSCLNSQEDIEEVRERIKAETSLLVVGGADEQLRLARSKKKQEGLTQNMVDRLIMDQIGEFLGNVLTMQQRNENSDAEDTEMKRKKRKRSISRDLASELGHGTAAQVKIEPGTHSVKKSPKRENSKTLMKIPVGGTLGAISNVRGLSQPSPAKRPRPSRSKASKASALASSGTLPRVLPAGSVTSQAQMSAGLPQTAMAGLPMRTLTSSVPRQLPLTSASMTLASQAHPQVGQGFVSLAAKGGGVGKEGVSHSYMTMPGSGSPSIITTGSGSMQYIIKPQSHRHLPLPISAMPGTPVTQTATVSHSTGASLATTGVRYTSLAQSPTSPFTSILNLKNTSSNPQGSLLSTTSGVKVGTRPVGATMVRPTNSVTLSKVSGSRVVPASMLGSYVGKQPNSKQYTGQAMTSLPQHMAMSSQARPQMSPTSVTRTLSGSSQQLLKTLASQRQGVQRAMGASISQGGAVTSGAVLSGGKPGTITTRLPSGQIVHSSVLTSTGAALAKSAPTYVYTSPMASGVRTVAGQMPLSVQLANAKPGTQLSVPATVIAQIANSAKALAAQVSTVRSSSSQVPTTVQIAGRTMQGQQQGHGVTTTQLPASIQLAATQGGGSNRMVNLNLPIRVAVTQGGGVSKGFPATIVTRTVSSAPVSERVLKTTGASVAHLQVNPRFTAAAATGKPQSAVSRSGVIPSSVMIKGGSPVTVQSVLAGLPPGTRVIATTTADGNVYVVGQVQCVTSRPKIETSAQKAVFTTAAGSSTTAPGAKPPSTPMLVSAASTSTTAAPSQPAPRTTAPTIDLTK